MANAGWYPDPAGAPNLYRYWNGVSWSAETTTDPKHAPTPGAPVKKKSNTGFLIALAAILLATALIIWLILSSIGRGGGGGGTVEPDWNSSKPTVTAWDETSTPTPPPTGGLLVDCPVTLVKSTTRQLNDGYIRGGGLKYEKVNGWTVQPLYLQWVSDFAGQVKSIYPTWMSNVGVGALNNKDGFTDLRVSATQTLDCFASSGYYLDFIGRENLIDEATTVDGRPAWRIRANVFVHNPDLPQVKGDVVDIIVVDLGSTADHLGLFVSSATIEDYPVIKIVDDVIASLRIDN